MHSPPLNQAILEQLDDVVLEVFEQMLARSCEPGPCVTGCDAAPEEPGFAACVQFTGALEGTCALHLDPCSAAQLTESLTGEAPEPDPELASDAVGELCNMIAGSWKSRLRPELAACHLSSPRVERSHKAGPANADTTRTYSFAPYCLTLQLTLR